jgi:hypothetical protein
MARPARPARPARAVTSFGPGLELGLGVGPVMCCAVMPLDIRRQETHGNHQQCKYNK